MSTTDSLFGPAGRNALVTGGSRGIGRAACPAFAGAGAAVVVHYHRDADAAREVVSEIEALGGTAIAAGADVSAPAEVERMMAAAAAFCGDAGLHVLLSDAGI